MNLTKLDCTFGIRKICDLKPLEMPVITEAYSVLEEDIKANGLYTPLFITKDDLIIDGVRRHNILLSINKDTQVNVMVVNDDLSEDEILQIRTSLNANRRFPSMSEIKKFLSQGEKHDLNSTSQHDTSIEHIVDLAFRSYGIPYRLMKALLSCVDIYVTERTQQSQKILKINCR